MAGGGGRIRSGGGVGFGGICFSKAGGSPDRPLGSSVGGTNWEKPMRGSTISKHAKRMRILGKWEGHRLKPTTPFRDAAFSFRIGLVRMLDFNEQPSEKGK